ncbi:phenylacetaldoxime dehydratase family protein [Glaciimonas sp. PCH181]|uniref:phenylacetaldoxime dehydratase family protein n=1 Tax=Glaciimonas sp. PCH181 TaxID=2133943 RepID=UPI000D36B06B|nr:phenylacetaldoxime dehydratase family protein [Glaciimonas sp. PCH181]PUA20386.1 phenylacetaldoxime dehydratase [Glaciimonas sp. PCH181]
MESAIDKHLMCPRTRTRRIDDEYQPPFEAWVARADASVKQVVMGYFGVQTLGQAKLGTACATLRQITESFMATDGPGHHDLAHYIDAEGYDNMVATAYWDDPEQFKRWEAQPEIANWWLSDERLSDGVGHFREIILPKVEQFETLLAFPEGMEGVAVIMGERSGEIQEHGYWGGMRDRIADSQTDAMLPLGELKTIAQSGRVFVQGHENLTVIRSGQDWSETVDKERHLYLTQMEPTLRAGMDFLRDKGAAVGCYNNRYMQHVDAMGQRIEKAFSVSHWRSLGHLERWSESHPTHIEIFGTFMRLVMELGGELKWKGYHEVSVLKADEQRYEYINCHANTGLSYQMPG